MLQKEQEVWKLNEVFPITARMEDVKQFYGFSIMIQYDESYLEPVKNHLDLGDVYTDKKLFLVSNHVGNGKVRLTGTLLGKESQIPKAGELFQLGFKAKKEGITQLKIENIKVISSSGEKQEILCQDLQIIVNRKQENFSEGHSKSRDNVEVGISEIEMLDILKDNFQIDRMDHDTTMVQHLAQKSSLYKVSPKVLGIDGPIRIRILLSENENNHHALGIYQFDEDKGYWRYQGGEVDITSGNITGEVNLFQEFAVFEYIPYRDFLDVVDPRIKKGIKRLVMEGIVQGYEDNTFRLGKKVTREEFIVLLLKAKRIPIQDCGEDWQMGGISEWAKDILYTAYQHGIIKGYGDGTMRGSQEITRMEAAVILDNVLKLEPDREIKSRQVIEELPTWAAGSVERIYVEDIMMVDPTGNFYPQVKITRIEMVKILNSLLDIDD